MKAGDRVDGRFAIERVAGAGGMGVVYKAVDLRVGGAVALKVLASSSDDGAERFAREGRALAELRHPGIVRYVAHGRTVEGDPYLAMEWLEGENLAERLARGALAVSDAVALVGRVAEALQVAHRRGIVHRDLKPSNLFLDGGDLARPKVLDFGIARIGTAERTLTSTGAIVGTPGYLSPEQARGAHGIDARSDVFSLGCVLFKCLTGQTPFEADDMMAVLLKLILDAPPTLRSRRPEASPELDELVARMLERAPEKRPRDAADVARLLAALPRTTGGGATVVLEADGISGAERRLTTLLVSRLGEAFVRVPARAGEPDAAATGSPPPTPCSSLAIEAQRPAIGPRAHGDDGATAESAAAQGQALRHLVEQLRGQLEVQSDGVVVVAFTRSGARDQATFAARCALAMQHLLGAHGEGEPRRAPTLTLVTGRATVSRDRVDAEALRRRAARLDRGPGIWVDAETAGLLGPHFHLELGAAGALDLEGGARLLGEHDGPRGSLADVELPLAGRDRELALLGSHYREAVAGPVARAVVLTGEAGMGKSRLLEAFARQLERGEADLEPPRAMWLSRASPAAGPLGLVASIVARAAGLEPGDARARRRRKIEAIAGPGAEHLHRLLGLVERDDHEPMTERTPLPIDGYGYGYGYGGATPGLATSRRERDDDAAVGAFEGMLARACAAGPVVLLLEDLHLAETRSVEAIAGALARLERAPLFVLATSRESARVVFGEARAAAVAELRLRELSRRHAERLAREVLGEGSDVAAAVAARSLGRPLFVEALARAAARGDHEWPDVVLGTIEGSLSELDPEARRVLRAASVFGAAFTQRGADAVLGSDADTSAADWLGALTSREVVERGATGDDPRDTEYAFRLDVVRAAVYATLTDDDARLAHRAAARLLTARVVSGASRDQRAVAAHLERGGDVVGAASLVVGLARDALRAGRVAEAADVVGAAGGGRLGERWAAGAAAGTPRLGALLGALARWSGDLGRALELVELARAAAPAGTDELHEAEGEAAETLALVGTGNRLAELAARLRSCCDVEGASLAHLVAAGRAAHALSLSGRRGSAHELLEPLRRDRRANDDGEVAGHFARATAAAHLVDGDPVAYAHELEAATALLERAGAVLDASDARIAFGFAALRVGRVGDAAYAFDAALATAQAFRVAPLESLAKAGAGQVLRARGALDAAHATTREAVRAAAAAGDRVREGFARALLALVEASAGDAAGADVEAGVAAELLGASPRLRALPLAIAARAALALGDDARATRLAQEARGLLDVFGALEHGEALVRLVHVEILAKTGRGDVARAGLGLCRTWLLGQAARINEPDLRVAFLTGVDDHSRIMALARAWTSGS